MKQRICNTGVFHNGFSLLTRGAAGMCLLGVFGGVQAFPIATGNDDIVVNWDQTVRYNYGQRIQGRNDRAAASTAARDESEFLFDKGDTIMNRLDLYSEFDLTYQRRMGFRVSGTFWYDDAYADDKSKSNPAFATTGATQPNYVNNNFSPYVKRYYHGPSGEFVDAFVWANFEASGGTANVKVGRYGLLWGESFFNTGAANSVAASMAPVDGLKLSSSPGATAKETLIPLNQASIIIPLTSTVELDAQYTFEYRASRAPEAGTYFGLTDVALDGPDLLFAGGAARFRQQPNQGRGGDIGLMMKFTPAWMDGTLSVVYRRYDDKNYGHFVLGAGTYRYVANRNIELYGVTLNKNILGVAVGAEVSQRKNQTLPSPGGAIAANSASKIPTGETMHALINGTKAWGKTSVWDTATLVGELTWSHLSRVSTNVASFQGNSLAGCINNTLRLAAGCPTKEAYRLDLLFNPGWQQVFPGVDLSMPLVYQIGLKGNTPAVGSGQNEGSMTYQIGLSATVFNVHFFSLAYTGFDNKHKGTGATYINNGSSAYYDRGWLNFNYRTNF